jgi:hypothetical protein
MTIGFYNIGQNKNISFKYLFLQAQIPSPLF